MALVGAGLGGSEGKEVRVGEFAIALGFAGSIVGDQLISGRGPPASSFFCTGR